MRRKTLTSTSLADVTYNNNNNPTMSEASHAAVNGNIRSFANFLNDNNIRIGMYYVILLITNIIYMYMYIL